LKIQHHFIVTVLMVAPLFVAASPKRHRPVSVPAVELTPNSSLAVLIVVDQLRPDDLSRVWKALPPGGFKALAQQGVEFTAARQDHGVTFTCPGHAALVTGVYGARNGIVGNTWWDRAAFRAGSCGGAGQPDCMITCGVMTGAGEVTQLKLPAVGDILKLADPAAKVIAISYKESATMAMAGTRADIALTFGEDGKFMVLPRPGATATPLPAWVNAVNEKPAGGETWQPLPLSRKLPGDADEVVYERPPDGWSRSFPHAVARRGQPGFVDQFVTSPFSFDAELNLALGALEEEKLGQRGHHDLLLLSFSGYDLIGHAFGHDSLELRDATLRLDRVIASLLEALRKKLGDGGFTVILTSDHGAAEIPERRAARLGDKSDAGRIEKKTVADAAEKALADAFGPAPNGSRYVAAFHPPHLYLNDRLLAGRQLAAEEIVQSALGKVDHVAGAFLTASVCVMENRAAKAYCADADLDRAGDLLVLQQENYIFGKDATTHGGPWDYDQAVPLFVYPAPQGARKRVIEPVSVACVAAQLARELALANFPPDRAAACLAK
jgi:hypothetical protein